MHSPKCGYYLLRGSFPPAAQRASLAAVLEVSFRSARERLSEPFGTFSPAEFTSLNGFPRSNNTGAAQIEPDNILPRLGPALL